MKGSQQFKNTWKYTEVLTNEPWTVNATVDDIKYPANVSFFAAFE